LRSLRPSSRRRSLGPGPAPARATAGAMMDEAIATSITTPVFTTIRALMPGPPPRVKKVRHRSVRSHRLASWSGPWRRDDTEEARRNRPKVAPGVQLLWRSPIRPRSVHRSSIGVATGRLGIRQRWRTDLADGLARHLAGGAPDHRRARRRSPIPVVLTRNFVDGCSTGCRTGGAVERTGSARGRRPTHPVRRRRRCHEVSWTPVTSVPTGNYGWWQVDHPARNSSKAPMRPKTPPGAGRHRRRTYAPGPVRPARTPRRRPPRAPCRPRSWSSS